MTPRHRGLQPILVPLDGSPLAERSLPLAAALARGGRGRLILLRARAAGGSADSAPGTEEHPNPSTPAVRSTVRGYLEGVAERLHERGVPALIYQFPLAYESVADAILTAVRQQGARLIVMSTHGRGGLGRMIYGSVADDVLRRAEVPVMLVSAICDGSLPMDRPPRILVPLDGSSLAEQALEPAAALADLLRAEIALFRAVHPIHVPAYVEALRDHPVRPEAELVEARTYLEGIAGEMRSRRPTRPVSIHTMVSEPAPAIAAAARDWPADIVAMATHGRRGLARLVLGSVASGVLHRVRVPLLLVRPSAVRQPVEEESTEALPRRAGGARAVPSLLARI